MGTFSSEEQVHLSPPRVASHWAMAVYCVMHVVIALTVALAAFTQLGWQSVTGHALVACDAHIAVQAWSSVDPVPESRERLPPPPPEPAVVPPVTFVVRPPRPAPPVADNLPPLPVVPPSAPPPVPVPGGLPPLSVVAPRAVTPPLELAASFGSAPLPPLEQPNTRSITTGKTRKMEPVLCIGNSHPTRGSCSTNRV
jgi:hypothetical protein